MKLHHLALATALSLTLLACTNSAVIEQSIKGYDSVAGQIDLGSSKSGALALLEPTQAGLTSEQRKRPDRFIREGVQVEIFYFRTAWHDDGITTDDEFTPYVFNNDKLVAIGWHALGGAKSLSAPLPNDALSTQ